MARSKTFNVARSTITGVVNSLALLLLNLLSRKLFLQYIGIEYLSVAQVIMNLLAVFSFTELGLSNSVLYMLYDPVANQNYEGIKRIIWLYKRFNRYIGIAIGVCGVVFMPFLHIFIKTSVNIYFVYVIYALNLLSSASTYFYTYRSVLLGADQRDYVSSIVSTSVSFVRILLQCTLIYLTHSYLVFLITGLLSSIVQNAIVYVLVGKMYPFVKDLSGLRDTKALEQTQHKLLHNIASMASIKITGIVINNTDTILVSWINTLMVGICSNYTIISMQLKNLISIFHSSLLHSVGIASAEKDDREKYELFKKVLLINTFISGLISVCLGVLWNDFIIIWIGEEYLLQPLIYLSLLLNFAWGLFIAPIWLFRDANGLFIYIRKMLLLNALINIVLSFLLGHFIGIGGIFIATIIADILTDFWFDSNIIFRKVFKKKNGLTYQLYILENMMVIIIISLLFSYITRSWNVNSIVWLCKAVMVTVFYIAWFIFRNSHSKTYIDIKENMVLPFVKKVLSNLERK